MHLAPWAHNRSSQPCKAPSSVSHLLLGSSGRSGTPFRVCSPHRSRFGPRLPLPKPPPPSTTRWQPSQGAGAAFHSRLERTSSVGEKPFRSHVSRLLHLPVSLRDGFRSLLGCSCTSHARLRPPRAPRARAFVRCFVRRVLRTSTTDTSTTKVTPTTLLRFPRNEKKGGTQNIPLSLLPQSRIISGCFLRDAPPRNRGRKGKKVGFVGPNASGGNGGRGREGPPLPVEDDGEASLLAPCIRVGFLCGKWKDPSIWKVDRHRSTRRHHFSIVLEHARAARAALQSARA